MRRCPRRDEVIKVQLGVPINLRRLFHGVVVRPPASQRDSGSSPGGAAPGSLHMGIVSDDPVGQRVFSGISHLPRPPPLHSCIAPYSPRFTLIGSQDLAVRRCPAELGRECVTYDALLLAGGLQTNWPPLPTQSPQPPRLDQNPLNPSLQHLSPRRLEHLVRDDGEEKVLQQTSTGGGDTVLSIVERAELIAEVEQLWSRRGHLRSSRANFLSAFVAEKRGSYKGDTARRIKCAFASECKALNWHSAVFSSCDPVFLLAQV
ncbi:hypothetical protein PR048_000022 [Dryococelus australis]|uniref:Uncharacterized protein n=1 Tax=Dryococelus australis TaxID=614101 RepID=A0ABQ9IER7_9NEOP|nr:hypothetical protein PR048_000022 [Dryococelus australis]